MGQVVIRNGTPVERDDDGDTPFWGFLLAMGFLATFMGMAFFCGLCFVNEEKLSVDENWTKHERTQQPILGVLKTGKYRNRMSPIFPDGLSAQDCGCMEIDEVFFDASPGECYLVTIVRSEPKVWPVTVWSDVKQTAHLSGIQDIR